MPVRVLRRMKRGQWLGRGPDLSFIPRDGNTFGTFEGNTTHSGPWAFLQRVPLVFYGPGFIESQGDVRLKREVTLADVAPTVARLLRTPPPRSSAGRPIHEALLRKGRSSRPPRLIVTLVWDGGGWNVLERWRGSWPFLESIMAGGTSVTNATVGTSPSITPAVHATLGTGAWPSRHGIVNIFQRQGNEIKRAFGGSMSPRALEIPTLADVYDRRTGNRAKVGFVAKDSMHIGMMGHGSYLPGGDRDIAVLPRPGESRNKSNRRWYSLPPYLVDFAGLEAAMRNVDADDGKIDGAWLGHDLPAASPVETIVQTRLTKTLLSSEGFGEDRVADLFFTNYKDIDYAGHAYNFQRPEVGHVIRYADRALETIVGLLDRRVGPNRWVLVFTADHGQSPLPTATGILPIDAARLQADLDSLGGPEASPLVAHIKQNGVWVRDSALDESGIRLPDLARFMLRYTLADNRGAETLPQEYSARADEGLFAAAFPSAELGRILKCARGNGRGDQHQ